MCLKAQVPFSKINNDCTQVRPFRSPSVTYAGSLELLTSEILRETSYESPVCAVGKFSQLKQ